MSNPPDSTAAGRRRGEITLKGVRVHNLKDLDLSLPRHRLVVVTGPSGSGKSSLAFDTLYAEGQRRYIESLSSYAHQFLDQLPKPDVDRVDGLSLDSRASLRAEFSPTAKHLRGTLSMARAGDPDSAGSQFFICVDVTASLDRQYSVFGHVVSGMDAVDAIVSAPLDGSPRSQRPANPVAIDRCEIVGDRGGLSAEEELLYQEMRQSLLDAGSKW